MEEATTQVTILAANPFRCRMWDLHDRLDSYINEQSCRKEIESFEKHGQRHPVLGRKVRDDPDYDIELIYGARRLFVARHLNTPVRVELRELSNLNAVIAMDIENRMRKDLSPYERGLSFARWLRANHFRSQDEIARTLQMSNSQVCRMLRLAQLPSVIVGAFAAPSDIRESWGLNLAKTWEDPAKSRAIGARARSIAALVPRPSAEDVYRQLTAAARQRPTSKRWSRDEVVTTDTGAPLFRIRHQQDSVAVVISNRRLSSSALKQIRETLKQILQFGNGQVVDLPRRPVIASTREPGLPANDAML
jgi:ParB family chromosome partitioning protein